MRLAKHGSIKVASLLKKRLNLESAKGDFGQLISKNCAGQSKDLNLGLMYLLKLHSACPFEFDHIYLVLGTAMWPAIMPLAISSIK